MSERTFSVVLSARVDQYVASMNKAKAATTGFSADTSKNMAKVGSQMQTAGRAMTTGLTAPIVALGTGAGKLAYDFETAFAQMQGLANVPASEIDGLKKSVLDLGRETAVAPQELADALYFAASAGLDAAGAMDAVGMAAKATAAGMGSTTDVVGLVSSAVASYGAETITAARATDILTATVRAGRADPAELAGSLGRLLPIAASLGMGFEDVGGATAYMSNVLGDTGRTVTAMSGLLTKLVAPTAQGRAALSDMGTSMEELKAAIREDGLMGALDLLREKGFGANQVALRALFDDQEGFVAAQTLLADANGQLAGTMDAVANSSGALGSAYDAVASTDAFAMKQALTDVKASLTEVGMVLLPLAADVIGPLAGAFSDVVSAIAGMPAPLRDLTLGFIGILAAAGPITMIGGSLVKNFEAIKGGAGLVSSGLERLGVSAGTASTAMGWLGIAAAAVGAAYMTYQIFTAGEREVAARAAEVAGNLDEATNAAIRNASATNVAAIAHIALSTALTSGEGNGKRLTEALGTLGFQATDALDVLLRFKREPIAAMQELGKSAGLTAVEADNLAKIINDLDEPSALGSTLDANGVTGDLRNVALAMEELQDQSDITDLDSMIRSEVLARATSSDLAMQLLEQAEAETGLKRTGENLYPLYDTYAQLLAENADALGITADATTGAADATGGYAGAAQEATVAAADLADSLIDPIDSFNAGAAAANTFKSALEAVFGPTRSLEQAQQDWEAGVDSLTASFKKNGATLDEHTEKGRANRDAVKAQVDNINDLATAMIANGATTEEAAGAAGMYREGLIGQMDQLGLTREQAEAYLATLGMTPENIDTAVKLAHDEEAKGRVEKLLSTMGDLPESTALEIQADIDNGAFDEAERRIRLIQTMTASKASLPVLINTRGGTTAVPQAEGGYWSNPVFAMLGEAGDEVVLPLTRPGRMAALLSDPRVGPRVRAALGVKAFANGGGVVSGSDRVVAQVLSASGAGGGDQSKLMANRFETGDLSAGDYRAFLDGRLSETKKFSDEWMQVWRELRGLDDDAKKSDQDQLQRDAELQKAMLETGAISTSTYEQFLQRRLGLFEQYSADWMQVWRELKQMQDDDLSSNEDLIKSAYSRSKAQQDLIEAERDLGEATQDANDAINELSKLGKKDDRTQAQKNVDDAKRRVAEAAFKGAGARANANGLADGSVEWARFMRAEISAYAAANPDLAGRLNELLTGVPAFAGGGFVKARPGGMLARIGEGGQDEWIFNRRQLTAFADTSGAAVQSARHAAQLAAAAASAGGGGLTVNGLTVGDRRDLPAVGETLAAVAWRARRRR